MVDGSALRRFFHRGLDSAYLQTVEPGLPGAMRPEHGAGAYIGKSRGMTDFLPALAVVSGQIQIGVRQP